MYISGRKKCATCCVVYIRDEFFALEMFLILYTALFTQAMKMWLLGVAKHTQSKSDERNGIKMAIGMILILCWYNRVPEIHLEDDDRKLLLSLLELKPNVEAHSCHDFQCVKGLISDSIVKKAVLAVKTFSTPFARNKHLSSVEWLYAIPFLHFLEVKCTPFQKYRFDFSKLEIWEDKTMLLSPVESVIQHDQAAQQGKYK